MVLKKLKSHAKINISLNVLKKNKKKLHDLESLVSFIQLADKIYLNRIYGSKHIIKFYGRFAENIKKVNTISKLLYILDKKKLLNNDKFKIIVKKNIPSKSGLGGGSMNAATLLVFFKQKYFNKINNDDLFSICNYIGSDVILGLERKNCLLFPNQNIKRSKKSINFHVVLVKPNFGCSTSQIFRMLRKYSKKNKNFEIKKIFSEKILKNSRNDLENVAIKKYPRLSKLKQFMEKLPSILFVRMTGSGSCFVGYFNSKNAALNGAKIVKKKYKNYWCTLSKTI